MRMGWRRLDKTCYTILEVVCPHGYGMDRKDKGEERIMSERYDVAIIGCGEAGIYAGYELMKQNPGLKVVVLEQGRDIYSRSCPIVAGKVKDCIQCKVCDTMCGFGGAGAFSDGKFNFTTAFGGWLTDFMDAKEVMDLIEYVDSINVAHGATTEMFSTSTPEAKALEKKALEFDLHLLQARCKHLGTEKNLVILQNIYEDLKKGIEFRFNTSVKTIDAADGGYRLGLEKGDEVSCDWLIAAPGRSGAEWFANECKRLGIPLINNQVDIGVRVELPARVFEHITNVVYESKLVYRTKQFPRKNTLKLLLLIDSGGSMEPYQRLCSMLFQAVSKAGHFKDLKILYFHNRPGNLVYKDPTLTLSSAVETEWILKNLSRDYRVIFIGDAEMSVNDLMGRRGAGRDLKSGMDWLREFKNHYSHIIWMHPQTRPSGHSYWTQSFDLIAQLFQLYQITLDGLSQGIQALLVNR